MLALLKHFIHFIHYEIILFFLLFFFLIFNLLFPSPITVKYRAFYNDDVIANTG